MRGPRSRWAAALPALHALALAGLLGAAATGRLTRGYSLATVAVAALATALVHRAARRLLHSARAGDRPPPRPAAAARPARPLDPG